MCKLEEKVNVKIITALALMHFVGDFYSSFSTPLMPMFVEKLTLSMAQVGLLTGIIRFLAFIIQPMAGYLADNFPNRFFAIGGLLLTIIFIPLAGIAPNYLMLTLAFSIGSMGSSMFHPTVAGMIPLYSGKNTGLSMSVFNTGGTVAFGIGPIFITWYVITFGLSTMPAVMMIGLLPFVYLYYTLPRPKSEGFRYAGFFGSLKETIGAVWKPLALIWAVMVIRSMIAQSFITFIPVWLSQRGYPLLSIGAVTSAYVIAGTTSGIIAGFLSAKIDFKKIFLIAHLMMTPALLLFLHATGSWIFIGAVAAGFFALSTIPLGVVMAQELAPKGRSMVASLMMGLAYGMGGVLSPIVGQFADIYSIQAVLFYVAFIPLLSILLIFFFPRVRQ